MKNHVKRMFAAAKKSNELELFVYNTIGEDWYGEGITPQSVANAIKEAGEFSSITVHINSPGGASFDGVAIHNILRQQGVPVNVVVEGLAASAAFTVAMAGDSIKVCDGAMMMLHNAWSFTIGDAKEMRKMADLLDKVSGTMCDVYAKRSGLSAEDVQTLMDAETWLSPQEAVDKGFATEKLETTPEKSKEAAALAAKFDLSKFCAKVPENLKPKAENDNGCQCSCPECEEDECEECSNPNCSDPNCEHAEAEAKACTVCGGELDSWDPSAGLCKEHAIAKSKQANANMKSNRSRLRLAELGGKESHA